MINNEIEFMKQFIYDKTSDTFFEKETIENYLKKNEILYSKNNNGIFINISLLEDKQIILLYKLIKININNDFYEEETEQNLKKNTIITQQTKTKKKINKKNNKQFKSFKLNKLQVNLLATIFKST